jgi:hypothetical protein
MTQNPIFEAAILAGRQQAFAMLAYQCTYEQAVFLREVRQSKAYRRTRMTWEQFCTESAGLSRITAEKLIDCLDEFGEAYFRLCGIARMSADAFRPIAGRVTADTIELDGECVRLIPENAPKIRAGVQRLRAELRGVTPADGPSASDTDSAR